MYLFISDSPLGKLSNCIAIYAKSNKLIGSAEKGDPKEALAECKDRAADGRSGVASTFVIRRNL